MKRKALGLLLFLLIIPLFMGCDQTTTIQATTNVTETETNRVTSTIQVTTDVTETEANQALGTVTFEIITLGDDPSTTAVETEYVSNSVVVDYFEGDTLFDLLDSNFTMTYEESTYGRYLTSIDTVIPGDGEYVSFYIDGDYSMTGIDDTDLTDGTVYQFEIGS